MAKPAFLVVGAQRAGTTWLDRHLRAHPEVYLPLRRKEIHYFDRFYDRGPEWYESFFPRGKEAARYRAIGEITPKYLFDRIAPERIRRDLPDVRLVAILRNPVDRAYSQYALAVRDAGERGTFEEFVRDNPDVVGRGLYTRQLERYLGCFPRDRFLVLLFEEMMADAATTLRRIAKFLDIDPGPFEKPHDRGKVNASYRPRYPGVRATVRKVGDFLRYHDLDWFVNVAKEMGVPHLFGNAGPLPPLTEGARRRLTGIFEDDVAALERLLGKELPEWKTARETITA